MARKYEPLNQYLNRIDKGVVRLRFSAIAEILGFRLPASAYKHPAAWWANHRSHVQAVAWMAAGWRKTDHSFQDEWVEFTKV